MDSAKTIFCSVSSPGNNNVAINLRTRYECKFRAGAKLQIAVKWPRFGPNKMSK